MLPRRFALIRHIDCTGVSGIGVVAYGVAFADGQVVLRWCTTHPATSMWASMDDLLAVHGHGAATSVEWIDAPHGDLEELPPTTGGGRRARRRAARASSRQEPFTAEPPDETPDESAADDDSSPPSGPVLRAVRTSQESAAVPPVKNQSSETEGRNGHLYIDTAPLLLTFRESDEEPVPRRRGGRHRREDPDEAS